VQQTFWRVIDDGCYVASLRTWYRVAARHRLGGDRRRHSTHPATVIPQLCAAGPNQVWSWDITRVKIKVQKTPLHLYLIEDVFSRKCVGWRLEHREHDRLADLIQTAVNTEGATPHTLHADGGPSMTSHEVAVLLQRLGIEAVPITAARVQRQPVLGIVVQNAQIRPGLPGHLRRPQSRPGLDRGVPRPVQR